MNNDMNKNKMKYFLLVTQLLVFSSPTLANVVVVTAGGDPPNLMTESVACNLNQGLLTFTDKNGRQVSTRPELNAEANDLFQPRQALDCKKITWTYRSDRRNLNYTFYTAEAEGFGSVVEKGSEGTQNFLMQQKFLSIFLAEARDSQVQLVDLSGPLAIEESFWILNNDANRIAREEPTDLRKWKPQLEQVRVTTKKGDIDTLRLCLLPERAERALQFYKDLNLEGYPAECHFFNLNEKDPLFRSSL